MVYRNRQLLSSEDARPAKRQQTKPCSDCPWGRKSLPGWLGSQSVDYWLRVAHSEHNITCHTTGNTQCAGAAIYRKNVCYKPRSPLLLVLPADRENVFASPVEFREHHEKRFKK